MRDDRRRSGRPARAALVTALTAVVGTVALTVGAVPAAAADACANVAVRTQQASTDLPDCRAYEQVSPADSTGGLAGVSTTFAPMYGVAGASGDRMLFSSSGSIGTTERGVYLGRHLAKRGPHGWSVWQALTTTTPDVDIDMGSTFAGAPTPAADMTRLLFNSGRTLGPPNTATGGGSIYRSAVYGRGLPTWLSQWTLPGTQPPVSGSASGVPLGGSPDLSVAYFSFPTVLTDQAGDGDRTPSSMGLYMYRDGALSAAGVLPSGTVAPEGALPAGSAGLGPLNSRLLQAGTRNQVSADGSHLFFVSPASGAPPQLYVQQNGALGQLISKLPSGAPAPDGVEMLNSHVPGADAIATQGYAFATADGSRVLFRSASVLATGAPAAGIKTYRATISGTTVTVQYLPSVDGVPLAVNADASRIFFAWAPTGVGGPVHLAVWDEHRAGGGPYTVTSRATNNAYAAFDPRMSQDGATVVFAGHDQLLPGSPVTPGGNRATQVYRWTIGDAAPTCLSCRTDGGAPARFGGHLTNGGDVTTDNIAQPLGLPPNGFTETSLVHPRGMSDDGRRVFFDTSDPLDPAHDTNGTRDVYVWEDGQTHLLTSGKGTAPSFLIDNSASGDDVFFTTTDGLVPSDTDGAYDVYDARVGGGFVEPSPPHCVGDGCQPVVPVGPSPAVPLSPLVAPVTVGPQKLLKRPTEKSVALRVRKGKVTRRRITVKVRTPEPGRIRVRGKWVRQERRSAGRSTTYHLHVEFTKRTRRALRRKGRLKLRLQVRFEPKKQGKAVKKTVKWTIKRHTRSSRKGR